MFTMHLPYPPSVNTYWKSWRGRVVISKEGKKYKDVVKIMTRHVRPTEENVSIRIEVYPPDRRRRDIDNVLKALLDSLNGVVYHDDSQIHHLEVSKKERQPNGLVIVTAEPVRGK
jgi:crossover junction endodeoxyribonuclease RusA